MYKHYEVVEVNDYDWNRLSIPDYFKHDFASAQFYAYHASLDMPKMDYEVFMVLGGKWKLLGSYRNGDWYDYH